MSEAGLWALGKLAGTLGARPQRWLATCAAKAIGCNLFEALMLPAPEVFPPENSVTGQRRTLGHMRTLVGEERFDCFTLIDGDTRGQAACAVAICSDGLETAITWPAKGPRLTVFNAGRAAPALSSVGAEF
ncbi:hypothetical protein ACFQPG_07245 [Sphingomonas sp. GCM10030256]|uniref:hypothetical protein n=1 Tax=Sphingomonas sp. GCM10030256 TaxID=3273427 RepID=UPI00360671CC